MIWTRATLDCVLALFLENAEVSVFSLSIQRVDLTPASKKDWK